MFEFKKYLSQLNKEPQWLKDKRTIAWDQFSKLPMPNPNEEGWRVLDLDAINLDNLLDNLKTTTGQSSKVSSIKDLHKHLTGYEPMLESVKEQAGIIIESPHGMWYHLDEQLTHQGVSITTLSDALATDKRAEATCAATASEDEHARLGKRSAAQAALINSYRHLENQDKPLLRSNKFALLNDSLCQDGIIVHIPEGVEIKKPLLYINLHNQAAASLTMSRLLLIVEKHARLSFVSVLGTEGQNNIANSSNKQLSLANCLLEVFLKPGAELNYVEVQDFSQHTFAVGHSYYTLDRDSRLNSLVAAFGGEQLKSEIQVILQEPGAESSLNGVILGNKNERFNFNTIEDHIAPNTRSNIDFRVALKDEAHSIYHGTIQVAKTAQKTEAFQSNKNLLLGEKAHADSIPNLEILADDVKCSHGATVGPVDRKQIFYLMSRGLSESQAEELIVNGFFHQLLSDCPIPGVSDWLDIIVANKIASHETETQKTNPIAKENKQPALTR